MLPCVNCCFTILFVRVQIIQEREKCVAQDVGEQSDYIWRMVRNTNGTKQVAVFNSSFIW